MKFSYNETYFPAAPQAEILLGLLDESLSIGPLIAFVDSGADATIVPVRHLHSLAVQAVETRFLRSQWGERRPVDVYWLDVGIAGLRLPAIEIVADEYSDEIIIGRNILNKLRVLLDGPKQTIEISE
jgi:predicted aspartyl protease